MLSIDRASNLSTAQSINSIDRLQRLLHYNLVCLLFNLVYFSFSLVGEVSPLPLVYFIFLILPASRDFQRPRTFTTTSGGLVLPRFVSASTSALLTSDNRAPPPRPAAMYLRAPTVTLWSACTCAPAAALVGSNLYRPHGSAATSCGCVPPCFYNLGRIPARRERDTENKDNNQ